MIHTEERVRALDAYVPQVVADWLDAEPDRQAREVDGSLVFADVSGFTPLSERLARKGKVGAEELTDILNAIFGELLDVAGGLGGDLLKFGGDALLLLFTGDGHAVRAAQAAASMQLALKARSRIDTGSGTVRLRMSVGVHSGPLLLFLVGTTHRELLITGPGATQTVLMESAADAGEVLLSPATAAALDPRWLAGEKDGGHLLRIARAATTPAPPPERRCSRGAAQGVPAGLRDYLRSAPGDGEHRQATLTFLQFKGLEALLADEGADVVAGALHELVTVAQAAADRHDITFLATDVDADGGKILFSAGAPRAGANDDDRMLQAMREVLDAGTRLDIRIGVNRGHAFAVDIGTSYRRTYAVMGDPTNLAARVMGKAAMRGLLATAAVVDRLRTRFELTPRQPFMVKGKSHPIEAADVGPVLAGGRGDVDRSLPLVGRDAERALFTAGLQQARDGQGTALVLVGEAGLGKSRLVEELRTQAADLPQVLVEGGQYAAFNPYFALRGPLRRLLGLGLGNQEAEVADALRARVKAVAPELEPWMPLLALPFGVELPATTETAALESRFRRERAETSVVRLLSAVLDTPTLIVVEDGHWLDEASSALLARVVAGCGDRPWFVCVTRRDEPGGLDPSGDEVTVRRLEPLDTRSAAALLATAADEEPLPPSVIAAIAERSGGNPLFLQELLAAARAGQAVDELPDSVEPLIAARIDTLPVDDCQVLRHASVLGVRFPAALLDDMIDEAGRPLGLDRRLDGPLGAFLTDDGGGSWRFRHALLRQVAYEGLPFRRRRALHRRAGELIEANAVPGVEQPDALLSLHFFHAQEYERAWRYSCQAAAHADDNWAAVEATALYDRAIECARHLPHLAPAELATVCYRLGVVAEVAGRYDDAARGFRLARQLRRSDPVGLAEVMLKDGWLRERSGNYSQALRWYTKGRATLEAAGFVDVQDANGAGRLHAELTLAYGAARLRQGRYRECIPHLLRAVEECEAVGDRSALAHAYYLLDWAYTDLGDPEAERWRELALPIYEELGDFAGQANVLNNLGIDAYYEGRWAEALELYERSRVAREKAGDVVQMGTAANNIGEILSDQGHLAEAEALFREALRVWRGSRFPMGDAAATSNLGRVASRSGRLDEAAERFEAAGAMFDAIGALAWRLEVDAREAERRVFAALPDPALELVTSIVERAERLGGNAVILAMVHRLAGLAHAQRGDLAEAGLRLAESVQLARSAGATYEVALSLDALAHVARLVGRDPTPAAAEAAELLAGLGVVSVPTVPLPTPVG